MYRGNTDARYHRAVQFAEQQVLQASDWQDVQHALAEHEVHGPWLETQGDPIATAQAVIRDAEARLGERVPY